MTAARQVLFIQGGGAGVHDDWDDKLVDSLRRQLLEGWEVLYPRMPDEGDPSIPRWGPVVRRELAGLEDGAVVVGHSLGGTILINTLTEQPQPQPLLQSPLESPSPSHSQPESPSHSESESDSESRNSGAVRRGSEQNEPARLSAIVLIAAPFVGEGGWPSEEFQLSGDLGVRLPKGAQVHVFHGLLDETAPPSHAELYAGVIPSARLHLLPARDHQLNNDLSEVAKVISPFVRR